MAKKPVIKTQETKQLPSGKFGGKKSGGCAECGKSKCSC